MKKIVCGLFTLLLAAFCFGKDWNFFVEPVVGVRYIKLGEYLYSSYNKSQKVSYLEWQNPALVTVGVSGGISWKNINLSGAANTQGPLKSGYMDDLDWAGSLQTNYATFDNSADKNYSLSVTLGYDFILPKGFTLTPLLQYEYSYDSFNATNGYGYYGNAAYSKTGENVAWNSSDARRGKCSDISYARERKEAFLGGKAVYQFRQWDFSLTALVSPFSYIISKDYHGDLKNEGNDYTMIAQTKCIFNLFKFDFRVGFKPRTNMEFFASTQFMFYPTTQGLLASNYWTKKNDGAYGILDNDEDEFQLLGQPSGTDELDFSVNLGIKFFF